MADTTTEIATDTMPEAPARRRRLDYDEPSFYCDEDHAPRRRGFASDREEYESEFDARDFL